MDLYYEILHRMLDEAKTVVGSAPLARIEQAIALCEQENRPVTPPDPMQEPGLLYIQGLQASAWHDPARFPDVEILERNFPVFLADLQMLLDRKIGFQPYDGGDYDFQPVHTNNGWNVFYFRLCGFDVPRNQELCPASAKVLQSLPNLAQSAYFSALRPGTHLVAHTGPENFVLSVHLGLSIPADCEMRVGRETRTWAPGKCVVFDDTFNHEVWHRGSETRFILLLDIWHPDLTPVERQFLARAMPAIAQAEWQQGETAAYARHQGVLDGATWWK
jgi:aspartyl/asparaginyl beta-hydroxylase (cupin superfamily)